MTRAQRWGWVAIAVLVALALLLLARSVAADEYGFMPKGGKTLLVEQLGSAADAEELRRIVQSSRPETEWKAYLAGRKTLTERERATLAAYLAVNMPLAGKTSDPAALPADGREIAVNECQSCHSLFAGYLTQSRDVQAWRNIFLSPFHRQMKLDERQREEFARYSALNMPMKVEEVPADLRF